MSERKKLLPDKCAVARDLMALCIDGVASDASQRRVKKHVIDCEGCAVYYQEMQTKIELDVPEKVDDQSFDAVLKKVKHKKHWRTVRIALLCTLLAAVLLLGGLQAWQYFVWDMQPMDTADYTVDLMRTDSWVLASITAPERAQISTRYERVDGSLFVWAESSRVRTLFPGQESEVLLNLGPWDGYAFYIGENIVKQICVGNPTQGPCQVIYVQGQELRQTTSQPGLQGGSVYLTPVPTATLPPQVQAMVDDPAGFMTPVPEDIQREMEMEAVMALTTPVNTPTPRPTLAPQQN